ncbi:hypothetical protein [Streptomyces sp. KMM 9044]|uniref:hypothetical protein n=1 Tax=Streptomyces sp. KMM 9044 TaxID=2744474 RepID=UPI0021507AA8|nr:hypothetical protein [Streptomyces sp. KMM 9044]WAX79550.1 hypothetical protein HUV60_019640 [Streptomyces sp. KMM 9044]
MPERDSILRVTGATVLTLVAAACTAGLAGVLRRDHRRVRGGGVGLRVRTLARAGAQWVPGGVGGRGGDVGPRPHRKPKPGRGVPGPQEARALRTIPRQRRTGSSAEQVRLTQAEREAFAALVRRFTGGRETR